MLFGYRYEGQNDFDFKVFVGFSAYSGQKLGDGSCPMHAMLLGREGMQHLDGRIG